MEMYFRFLRRTSKVRILLLWVNELTSSKDWGYNTVFLSPPALVHIFHRMSFPRLFKDQNYSFCSDSKDTIEPGSL